MERRERKGGCLFLFSGEGTQSAVSEEDGGDGEDGEVTEGLDEVQCQPVHDDEENVETNGNNEGHSGEEI